MQCNAELFVVENKLYGDVIELQFINVKSEPTNQIPWEVDLWTLFNTVIQGCGTFLFCFLLLWTLRMMFIVCIIRKKNTSIYQNKSVESFNFLLNML